MQCGQFGGTEVNGGEGSCERGTRLPCQYGVFSKMVETDCSLHFKCSCTVKSQHEEAVEDRKVDRKVQQR